MIFFTIFWIVSHEPSRKTQKNVFFLHENNNIYKSINKTLVTTPFSEWEPMEAVLQRISYALKQKVYFNFLNNNLRAREK